MNRLSAKMRMYIVIAVVALITLAVVFFVIVPLLQEASDLQTQIAAEKTNLSTAQSLVARRQSAKANSAANEVELMRIANQLPDSPQLPGLIIEVQDVANAAKVELPDIGVSEVEPATAGPDGVVPAYSVLTLTVRYTGDWANVIDFDRRLGLLDRGVRVVSSTFTYVPETDEEDPYVDAVTVLEVYMMPSVSASPAPVTATTTGQ